MIKTKGFSIPALLVILAILGVLSSIAFPLFNSYKQELQVNEAVSYVLNFQKDVESCVFERQNIADCDIDQYGIEAPPSLSDYNIIAYDVVDGTIRITLDNENLKNDTFPIEIAFYAEPKMRETVPTVNWTVYCNDYDSGNNQLYKLCKNDISDIPSELPEDWVTWKNFSTPWRTVGGMQYDGDWSPEADLQTQDYVQSRGFSYDQERDVVEKVKNLNTGQVIESLREREERTISDTESRNVAVSVSQWTDLNQTRDCSDWEPPRDQVEKGLDYTQERNCSIEQEREYRHTIGNNQPIHTRDESQVVQYTEDRPATGTMQVWFPIDSLYSSWTNTGSGYDYGNWTPVVALQTENFTQERVYKQNQERTVTEREQHSKNQKIRVTDTYTENQTITLSEDRAVIVNTSSWADNGAVFDCTTWTPNTSTVDEDETFTQSRTCQQDQERTWTYTANSSTIDTRVEERTIDRNQTQVVSGTNPVWIDTTPTYTNWVDEGAKIYTENWNPAVANQTSDFTQTRDYEQNQERTRTDREIRPATGDIRNISTTTETQTITGSDTRTVNVTANNWSNSSAVYSCTTWTPATSTVNEDETFTQSRTCQQDQERAWTYKVGSTTIDTRVENRTVDRNQTQTVSGTNPVWETTTPTYSDWENVGSRSYTSGWEPAISNQTSDFAQNRSYDQEQERTRSNREVRPATGDIRTVSTTTESKTITGTETRNITVTDSGWVNDGSLYNCRNWTPSPSTVNEGQTFTQNGICNQNQNKTWTYKSGSTTIDTWIESRTLTNVSNTRTATGTKPTSQCLYSKTSGNENYASNFIFNNVYYNGVIYSSYTYNTDRMSLTGTGTQADPYILETGEKFYRGEIGGYSGGYISVPHYEICRVN